MIKRIICGCMLCVSAGALAEGVATHFNNPIFGPPGVQPGANSVFFVPGGTVFRNPDASQVRVPTQTFTPYPGDGARVNQLTRPGPEDGVGVGKPYSTKPLDPEYQHDFIMNSIIFWFGGGKPRIGPGFIEQLESFDHVEEYQRARRILGGQAAIDAPVPQLDGVPTDDVM